MDKNKSEDEKVEMEILARRILMADKEGDIILSKRLWNEWKKKMERGLAL